MSRNSSNQQGMVLSNTIIHVENAIIEEVVAYTGRIGYVLISFGVTDESNMFSMQEVRLNVGNNTVIMDEGGSSLNLYDLREGMRIDGDFSSAMTRSIPPQSPAYRVQVLK